MSEGTFLKAASAGETHKDLDANVTNTLSLPQPSGCSCWPPEVVQKLGSFQARLLDAASWGRGPHEKSNWLIPGSILVGGWPYRLPRGRGSSGESAEEGVAKLHSILDAGINTFVSLTEDAEIRGKAYCFNSFQKAAEGRYRELHGPQRQAKRAGLEIRFLTCPMVDGGTCEDEKLFQLLVGLLAELRASRAVYIHCYGGHGRTGIVACSMLCLLWQITPLEAVKIFNHLHSFRVECGVGGPGQFPHSDAQLRQVERMSGRRAQFEAHLIPSEQFNLAALQVSRTEAPALEFEVP